MSRDSSDQPAADTPSAENRLQQTEARLMELEFLYTHLQQDCDTLNSTIVMQNRQIETLRLAVQHLEDRLLEQTDDRTAPDPHTELPPHY